MSKRTLPVTEPCLIGDGTFGPTLPPLATSRPIRLRLATGSALTEKEGLPGRLCKFDRALCQRPDSDEPQGPRSFALAKSTLAANWPGLSGPPLLQVEQASCLRHIAVVLRGVCGWL
jgi:hypothetical protein